MELRALPQRPTLTVVIPTLNEEQRLPILLGLLAAQTRPPDAVVVADASSTDATREVAMAAGASVVEGGMPAVGRNAGAAIATTDLLLFFDADVEPSLDWIERALAEFAERSLAVATAEVKPVERRAVNFFACDVVNMYLQLSQYISPRAPGACVLVRRDIHEHIGGFDTTVVLAEDHDYVQRASEVGKFRVLRGAPIHVSMRRLEKEGLITLSFKSFYSEIHLLLGRPVKELPFEYEFATFDDDKRSVRPVKPDVLHESLGGKIVGGLDRVSHDAYERLRRLSDSALSPEAIDKLLAEFAPGELTELRAYVRKRADMALRMPPIVLRRIHARGKDIWERMTGDKS
ncbi:MAG: glycosyltransferase [Actinobacteria bacterium]|nr:glycosyltransferase [Actinomycetota bacterium]